MIIVHQWNIYWCDILIINSEFRITHILSTSRVNTLKSNETLCLHFLQAAMYWSGVIISMIVYFNRLQIICTSLLLVRHLGFVLLIIVMKKLLSVVNNHYSNFHVMENIQNEETWILVLVKSINWLTNHPHLIPICKS